jgi:pimeloyl-ACP methyl ester carboxylesterase
MGHLESTMRLLSSSVAAVLALTLATPSHSSAREPGERVVLLHGLARSSRSMAPLAEFLRKRHFEVYNLDYPSREKTPEELVALVADAVQECCPPDAGRVHFVTHSLGGILVRSYLADRKPPNLGRVVMLAPPNGGSEIVDEWGGSPLFRAALGPTAAQLGTSPESLPNRIGPPHFELGVIAARKSVNPIGSLVIPGDDDGAVSVERAYLEGARDFLVVEASHTFIMRDPDVARQVVHFLREGRFSASPDATPSNR